MDTPARGDHAVGVVITVVCAREPIPADAPSVFLAGPTPRAGSGVPSWRPDAITLIDTAWRSLEHLTVLAPESRGDFRATHYDDQFKWETAARAAATVILFWIPRDLRTLPGFTTNVEFGYDVAAGRRVVLGAPPRCPNPERNRYLVHLARQHGVPARETLPDTVAEALALAVMMMLGGNSCEP